MAAKRNIMRKSGLLVFFLLVIVGRTTAFAQGPVPTSQQHDKYTLSKPALQAKKGGYRFPGVKRKFGNGPKPHHASGDSLLDSNIISPQDQKLNKNRLGGSRREKVKELLGSAIWKIQNRNQTSLFDEETCNLSGQEWPVNKASLLQRVTFSWVGELMHLGNAKPLEMEDLWELPEDQRMAAASRRFEERYRAAAEGGAALPRALPAAMESPIVHALWALHRGAVLKTAALRFFNTVVQFFPAVLVARLLKVLEAGAAGSARQGYLLAAALATTLLAKTVLENQYFYHLTVMGMQIRAALSTAVYRKALRLSPAARQAATTGELVNYMQLDSAKIEDCVLQMHVVWDGIFQILGFSALLVHYLGISVLPGIALIGLLIPINAVCYRKLTVFRTAMTAKSDARIKLTNEIVSGIRAIKFYNWEVPFAEKLEKYRFDELMIYKSSASLRALLTAATSATPAIVSTVTLLLYSYWTKELLQPSKIFTALSLFNQIRLPLLFYPWVLSALADGKVSLGRLDTFLKAPEVESYVERGDPGRRLPAGTAISLEDAAFAWNPNGTATCSGEGLNDDGEQPTLRGLNLRAREGELVAVVGLVGSGKSSVISALMGEMHRVCGRVMVKGRVAYVPQTPWIPHGTVRDNVCFGRPYDEEEYRAVIAACSLEKDIALLRDGDLTEIGERGINLSGGQKQRLSIARALYSKADVYLMDDPLSALDAEVAKDVFRRGVVGALGGAGATRVLVTNQLQFLGQADRVVVVGEAPDGSGTRTIVDQGTYAELRKKGRALRDVMKQGKRELQARAREDAAKAEEEEFDFVPDDLPADVEDELLAGLNATTAAPAAAAPAAAAAAPAPAATVSLEEEERAHRRGDGHRAAVRKDFHLVAERRRAAPPAGDEVQAAAAAAGAKGAAERGEEGEEGSAVEGGVKATAAVRLLTEEDRATGAVGASAYRAYLRSMRAPLRLTAVLLAYVVANGAQLAQQYLVSLWSSDPTYARAPLAAYSGGVALMALLVAAFNYGRTYLSLSLGVRASRNMHGALLYRVMGAPSRFFDTTPMGRIVQRFSKDLDQVDQQLINQVGMLITCALQMAGSGAAIIGATPLFALGVLPIAKIYTSVMNYFRAVSRELKRLNAISRSPIYGHFAETLGGLSTVRAFGKEQPFAAKNERLVDENNRTWFALKVVDRWLNMRLEALGNAVCYACASLAIYTAARGHLGAGLAGLALTQALSLTGLMNWAVRCLSETENLMASVERVQHMAERTPQEPPHELPAPPPRPGAGAAAAELAILPAELRALPAAAAAAKKKTAAAGPSLPPPPLASDAALAEAGWPWAGEVVFEGVRMRYRPETELVLRGVDLRLRPGEKVGVVGRTGSGKSSLMQTLYRMVDPEAGRVLLDGVDTALVGLGALRSRLTIIPQEPVLFSGTVRDNLDPLGEFSDEQIWQALERSSLGPLIRGTPGGLGAAVAEGGENFSAGQRQLVCLARAVLRRARVLLLDEATSSVDYETDAAVQRTLRREFAGCTVLTIAHRLNTILDSDRILVMDQGKVAEFDTPDNLLKNKKGIFYQLVEAQKKAGGRGQQKKLQSSSSNRQSEEEAII